MTQRETVIWVGSPFRSCSMTKVRECLNLIDDIGMTDGSSSEDKFDYELRNPEEDETTQTYGLPRDDEM
jgi:hypothetical protein